MEQNKEDIKIEKSWILKRSGCIPMAIAKFIIASIFVIVATLLFKHTRAVIYKIIGGSLLGVALWLLILIGKDLSTFFKLMRGKYKVKVMQVHDVRFRHPYSAQPGGDRMLVFSNMKITVDSFTARQFSVGSWTIVVFLDNVKYPIVIANLKEYSQD